jgi:hypothetical protein
MGKACVQGLRIGKLGREPPQRRKSQTSKHAHSFGREEVRKSASGSQVGMTAKRRSAAAMEVRV